LEYNNEWCFLSGPCRNVIRRTIGKEFRILRVFVKGRFSRCSREPSDKEMGVETEESALFEAANRERQVKIQTEKT
jgi:hypothetical protein